MARVVMSTAERNRIRDRLQEIESELADSHDFRAFAADTDAQYEMARAHEAGLRKEREQLKDLLNDE